MSQRFRGRSYASLLRKLPANLVVFDGHCLMCQARVQYVLERNFSYFNLLDSTHAMDQERLERNKMLFCTFDSVEGREIRRHFPSIARDAKAVVLVEKVPSQSAAFLARATRRETRRNGDASPLADITEKGLREMDIRVSVNFTAVCRIVMKVDRWLPRTVATLLYYVMPRGVGEVCFARVLARRQLWGTAEEDAMRSPKRIVGLKERSWRLRDG